jgi:hypothetical protein
MTVLRLNILKNTFFIKSLIVATFISAASFTGVAMAQATISVNPSTGLVAGQKVGVTASGLKHSSVGSIEECSDVPDPSIQPDVSLYGNATPVSCTAPVVLSTSATGTISSTFTIVGGVTGPPTTGTDTNHVSAATDATLFPCPPTAAQIAAGYSCQIIYGDIGGDEPSENISFASQTTTTPPVTTPTTTVKTSTTTSTPAASTSKLVDTGPGDIPLYFAVIAIVSGLAYFFFRRNTNS